MGTDYPKPTNLNPPLPRILLSALFDSKPPPCVILLVELIGSIQIIPVTFAVFRNGQVNLEAQSFAEGRLVVVWILYTLSHVSAPVYISHARNGKTLPPSGHIEPP